MPAELKVVLNVRSSPDMNVSMQFTHVGVDSDEDARVAGQEDARLVHAYLDGFAEAANGAA